MRPVEHVAVYFSRSLI